MPKISWKIIIKGVISIVMLAWFISSLNFTELKGVIATIKISMLLPAVVAVIASVMVSAHKWRIILLAQGISLGWRQLWRTYWAGLFFNNFLPSSIGGDALRILWAGKASGDYSGSTTSVVIERILATTGLALVGITASIILHNPRTEIFTLFCLLIIISILLVALLMWARLPNFIAQRDTKITGFITGINKHGNRFRHNPLALIRVIFCSAIFQLCVVAVNYFIFKSLSINNVDFIKAMYVVPVTSVASMLPLGINGYGVREGAYITLLSVYGVPMAASFSASVTFALLVSLCSLWGGLIWLSERNLGGQNASIIRSTISDKT